MAEPYGTHAPFQYMQQSASKTVLGGVKNAIIPTVLLAPNESTGIPTVQSTPVGYTGRIHLHEKCRAVSDT